MHDNQDDHLNTLVHVGSLMRLQATGVIKDPLPDEITLRLRLLAEEEHKRERRRRDAAA
jgi:hypothetical protein